MKRAAIAALILSAIAYGGTQTVKRLVIMGIDFDPNDPNSTQVYYRMATDQDIDVWYASYIAPRVTGQVQAMLADPNGLYLMIQDRVQAEIAETVPDPNLVVEPNELSDAITASELRDWHKYTTADKNWAHLIETTMLTRAMTEIQRRLGELHP